MKVQKYAAVILFLEGLASSGLQMVTIRQTVPFVGSSVLTTSIIISVFLAALALGYFWGGRQNSETYQKKLAVNLLISIFIFGIGLSYSFVSAFFSFVPGLTASIPIIHNPLVHLFLFCLIIMFPLVFMLSQTIPLLLNSAKQEHSKSESAGNATALSTLGNVVGCIFTSIFIMYFLGVGYSVLINCAILAFCLIFILDLKQAKSQFAFASSLCLVGVIYVLNIQVTKDLFEETTPYSNFFIADDPEGKRLVINRSSASFIDEEQRGWPYIEIMKKGIFSEDMSGKDILVLGAGGFTFSAAGDHDANIVFVDIDEKIKEVAEKSFLENEINGEFISHDARYYLLTTEKRFDVIIVDLYSNAATIPMHTSTYEFFSLVSSRLKDDGLSVMNIAANPRLSDNYSRNMDFTIRHSLSNCMTEIAGEYSNTFQNIVYFCQRKTNRVASLYRDDTTEVAVDGYVASMGLKKWKDNRGE